MRQWLICAAFSMLVATPAVAQIELSQPTPGYSYFNRPGATVAEHRDAVSDCITLALPLMSTSAQNPFGNNLIGALMSVGPESAATISGIENCMIVRGWRVVRLPEAEGEALSRLEPAELATRLEPWIGVETPNGAIVRSWNNDAANGANDRLEAHPRNTRNGALSLRALEGLQLSGPVQAVDPDLNDRRTTRSIDPDEVAQAGAHETLILLHLKGLSLGNGIGLVFVRETDGEVTRRDVLNAFVPLVVNNSREGNWRAYPVPPGRWRLAGLGVLPTISFCAGGPSFEARAGEVVYAGSFDLSANMGPDLSLDSARARLAGQAAASTVRAAEYTNGWTGQCFGNSLYALEIPGAPFLEGYVGGSAPAPVTEIPSDSQPGDAP
jgi:hypothetical protein